MRVETRETRYFLLLYLTLLYFFFFSRDRNEISRLIALTIDFIRVYRGSVLWLIASHRVSEPVFNLIPT